MNKFFLFLMMASITPVFGATQPTATQTTVNTAPFNKNLNTSDTNVQLALQTLDQLTAGGGIPAGANNQIQKNSYGVFAGANMYDNGYIGINKTNPSYQLDVNGQINASSGYLGIQASNVPTLNQNTTGTAAGISGSQTANTVLAAPNGVSGTSTFRSLVGADLPNPSHSTLGGIQSIAAVSHQWISNISNAGVPTLTQPSYTDLSGSVPAITALTGDITASGSGSVVATLPTVNTNVGTYQGITVNGKGLVTAATNQGYLTNNQTITWNGSGDITGSASGATTINPALTLNTVNSNVGTFQGLTVNGKGLVTAASNQSYITGNQTITASGDATGSGTTTLPLTLATVNTNTGSWGSSTAIPNFTVNGKGLMTAAGTNVVVAPAGTLTGTTLNSTVVNSSLTKVGTIATGTWQATPVTYQYGGTGLSAAPPSNNTLIGNGSGWVLTPIGNCNSANSALTYNTSTNSYGCNSIASGVVSISNNDGSLTFSPNSGSVIGGINPAHGNNWTGQQIFYSNNVGIGSISPGATLDVLGTIRGTNLTLNSGAVTSYVLTASDSAGDATWSANIAGGGWTQSGSNIVAQTANNVGIGTANPIALFQVVGGGNVGVNSTNPGTTLDVQGTLRTQNTSYFEESYVSSTSITPTGTYKYTYMANTQTAGTFTVNNPTNIPFSDGTSWVLKISSTAVQTFSWGTEYYGGSLGLPTSTSGTSTIQYFTFIWDVINNRFDYVGSAGGF